MDYFMNEKRSDVVFLVDGQRLPALKIILCMRNKVFRAMFSDNCREIKDKEIVIENTTFEAFKTFVLFLYSDRLVIRNIKDYELIDEICEIAERFEAHRLLDEIGDHFMAFPLTSDNITSILKIAFKYKIEKLMTKIMTFIDNNFDIIVNKDIKQLSKLNDSTHNPLLEVMANNYRKSKTELSESRRQLSDVKSQLWRVSSKLARLLEGKCKRCGIINLDTGGNLIDPVIRCKVCKQKIFL